jgi:nitrogen-specific signal transduction histidine kinase
MAATELDASRTMRDLLHDLRNSLSVILAHAHLLVSRPWMGSGVEALRVICQESSRMARMLSLIPDNLGGVTLDGDGAEDQCTGALPHR